MFDPLLEPSNQELEESDDDYDFIPVRNKFIPYYQNRPFNPSF